MLFLDASDAVLIRRYKETRRRHPLGQGRTLSESISYERSSLQKIKDRATYIIDTTDMRADALKNKIRELFSVSGTGEPMSVTVQSFGFKHGLPLDSDMVLDVRFLPNPFYEDDLRMLTGNDETGCAVYRALSADAASFLAKRRRICWKMLLPQYVAEGKSQACKSALAVPAASTALFILPISWRRFCAGRAIKVLLSHRDLRLKKPLKGGYYGLD